MSLGKNLILSGCFFYQLKNACIDKEIAEWSVGNKAANDRHIYTTASSKGWKAYMRSIKHEKFVDPHEYLELSKYTYPKYLIQDKDGIIYHILDFIFDRINTIWIFTNKNIFK